MKERGFLFKPDSLQLSKMQQQGIKPSGGLLGAPEEIGYISYFLLKKEN